MSAPLFRVSITTPAWEAAFTCNGYLFEYKTEHDCVLVTLFIGTKVVHKSAYSGVSECKDCNIQVRDATTNKFITGYTPWRSLNPDTV